MTEPTSPDVTPEPAEQDTTSPPRTPRRVAIVGARIVTGTVGLGVAALAIVAAGLLPLPTISGSPASEVVTPVPTAQELVCAGGILRLGDETGQDAETATSIGRPTVTSDASLGELEVDTLDGAAGNAQSAPRSLRAAPSADGANADTVLLAGAQSEIAAIGEFRGLAASACAGVTTDAWLAGGSTSVGRTTLISIANPSDVIATVDVEIYGEEGAVSSTGGSGIVVQPHAQRVIPLAGLAPDVVSPVIHVTSQGGQVVATLQQSTVRGLEPGGVEIIGTTARPASQQVIPGVVIANAEGVGGRVGEKGFDDLTTVLRVYVPGENATTVNVGIVAEDGAETGASFSFEVEAGQVTDLPIEELGDGTYTLLVDSDEPVLTSLRVATVATTPDLAGALATDFAWFSATAELTADGLVSIADGPGTVLHIANPGATALDVTLEALGGVTTSVSVPAGSTTATAVTPGTTYRLGGITSVWASVSLVGDGQLAAYGVQPPAVTSSAITVYP
jgi:hypothetical protein